MSDHGKCDQCHEVKELRIFDCGRNFCSTECQRLNRYMPEMTDATFEADTTIDEIEAGKYTYTLQTCDAFYAEYSGYKAIVVKQRGLFCKPEQIGSYHSVANARKDWERLKQAKGWKSWYDLQKEKKAGQSGELPAKQQIKPEPHVKVNLTVPYEVKVNKIAALKVQISRNNEDLIHYADLMECSEGKQRQAISQSYSQTLKAMKTAKDELEQLEQSLAAEPKKVVYQNGTTKPK